MVNARLITVAATLIAVVMAGAAIWLIITSPGTITDVDPYRPAVATPGEPVLIAVDPGRGPGEIGDRLEDAGVIDSSTRFKALVALMGYDRALQAGEYEFEQGTPALEVIYRMSLGILTTRSVTVVEGWRLEEIADALAEQGIPRDEFLAAASSREYEFDFIAGIPEGRTLEGFLYPATYPLRAADSPRDLVRRMLEAFDENVPPEMRESAADVGLDFYSVVTLASIIEREARVSDEKPVMAQVFLDRLAFAIPLQADPTVQYALGSDPAQAEEHGYWKQGLTLADLDFDSPYNTYVYWGLPPGPIAATSAESILAVVRPADTDYLYFVARPDGSHAFAETLEEHLQNVEMYQR